MNFKYTVISSDFNGPCIAVKYNGVRKELTIGGNIKFIDTMEFFLVNHFKLAIENCKLKQTQVNKIRYESKPVSLFDFREGMRELIKFEGFVTEFVRAHERIMR